jgi:GDP-L-fucose synthase
MILVLGGTGFVGQHVCRKLEARNLAYSMISSSTGVDLENEAATESAFFDIRPDKVINCAAFVGGISFVTKHHVDVFAKNMRMTLNILRAADLAGVKRIVNPISNCAYPARAELFREDEFWDGPMHELALVYGFVRKAFWVGSWAYKRDKDLDAVNLILPNMYGPNDHLDEDRSHALGALIRKFVDAKRNKAPSVLVWGTGKPVREWLYIEDGAEALIRGLDCPASEDPVNIGVAHGISIGDLATQIKKAVGYDGEIVFDRSRPDGAAHKTMDGSIGKQLLGWQPTTGLKEGMDKTIAWYMTQK